MYVLILWTKEKERERIEEEKKIERERKECRREGKKSHLNNEQMMLLALLQLSLDIVQLNFLFLLIRYEMKKRQY